MDRRPPLAVSPRRLRPRPGHASTGRPPVASSFQITPPGLSNQRAPAVEQPATARLSKKAQTPMRSSICALPRSSYLEPNQRAKLDFAVAPTPTRVAGKENLIVHDDGLALNLAAASMDNWMAAMAPTSPLFERGRLYDLYSARRNERLKRKHGWYTAGEEEAGAMAEDPCVAVELSKRRGSKKVGSESVVRRSMPAAEFSLSHRASSGLSAMRSSLMSSKEMKKASAESSCATAVKPSAVKERRVGTRSSVRRI